MSTMSAKVILVQSEGLGRGDDELGELLMSNFLRLLAESTDKPRTLAFWNSGVKLACEGSWALVHLKKLEERGVEILACGTCLDYFELKDKLAVGRPTTMADSVKDILGTEMVCL
jgi:selenium metabolism protein YedF